MLVAVIALAACGGSEAPQPSDQPKAEARELQMVLASSDLAVGTNRVVFGLIDSQSGPVREAEVQVATFVLTDAGQEGPKETAAAVFRRWPAGPGGVYTARLTFDRPGNWGLGAVATARDGSIRQAAAAVEVRPQSRTPAIGAPAPRSHTKTAGDVARLEEMTSDPEPGPELYSLTIAQAIADPMPSLVAFSTPAFCQTATCGPQLEVVKSLQDEYGGRANFIHVEIYDNPLEIEGDLSRGRTVPAVTEWNLPSEPWTFILDAQGLVASKFEGFATSEELEEALAAVLP